MPSHEYLSLKTLAGEPAEPMRTRAGDLWLMTDERLQYVMLVLGYKKRGRYRKDGHQYVFMYHWGNPSLVATPCMLRENDPNSLQAEASLRSHLERGSKVRYLGNIFDMLPLSELLT